MALLTDIIDILDGDPDLQETPVDVRTFVTDMLQQPPLSEIQYTMVEVMSQVYKRETLQRMLGVLEGNRFYDKYTKNEIVLQLGKGCMTGDAEIYNPVDGRWHSHIALQHDVHHGRCVGMDGSTAVSQYRTESFSLGMSDIIEVRTAKGITVNVAPDHKFYTRQGVKLGRDLQQGDRIALAARLPIHEPQRTTAGELELLCNISTYVPPAVWSLPTDQLAVWIRRQFDANATTHMSRIEYVTEIGVEMQRLLTRFGILASLSEDGSVLTIDDSVGLTRFYNDIKQQPMTWYANSSSHYDNDIYYDKVTSIKGVMPAEIFTTTAVDTENYVANLVLNGNSGK